MHPARSGDRNVVGGDRHLPDRGIGFLRRGDRYTLDRWNVSGGVVIPPVTGLNDGDPVALWKDSSTGGHDASQTGTARPTFKTNVLNGKPVVRYAAGQSLNIPSIPCAYPWSSFVVWKPTSGVNAFALNSDATATSLESRNDGYFIMGGTNTLSYYPTGSYLGAAHVYSIEAEPGSTGVTPFWIDGTLLATTPLGASPATGFLYLGVGPSDIAEVIHYSGSVAIRAKLLLVLTVLITTGQIPSTEEADALLASDDLVALEAYLIEHGVPVEQARDTLEPMAVGDRANIEKYLGTKYGITVAGGTAVQPDTVAGLVGWWKADSLAVVVPPPTGLLAGLVSYWKLDEASGTRMDSIGTNHLNLQSSNPAGITPGIINNAANFNGSLQEYLGCSSSPSLQMSGNTDFTISAWINLGSNIVQVLLGKDDSAANSRDYTIDYQNVTGPGGGIRFYIKGGTTYIAYLGFPLPVFQWAHVIAWYDSTNGQCHLSVNGGDPSSSPPGATGTDVSNSQFRIGARQYSGAEGYSTAAIDEVGIWKRKLTPVERDQLYNGGAGLPLSSFASPPAPPFKPSYVAGLQGWWKADAITVQGLLRRPDQQPGNVAEPKQIEPRINDGDAINTWPDSSDAGRYGTAEANYPTYKANQINGKPAVYFFGGGAPPRFILASPFLLASGWTAFSVMKPFTPANELNFLGDASTDSNWAPLSNGTNYYIGAGGTTYQDGTPDGNWHVFSGTSTPTLFIDGVSKSLAFVAGPITATQFNHIGARGSGGGPQFCNGFIAEIILYQGVLSTTDRVNVENYLKAKYAIAPPFDPTTIAGLKLWLKADAIAGPPADGATVNAWNDSSSNGYNLAGNTTFKTNILNGKPVLRFDGGGNYLSNGVEIGVSQPFTMFIVGKGTAGATVNFIETNISGEGCAIGVAPTHFGIYAGAFIGDAINHTGAFHVCSGVFNGVSSAAYLDGVQAATGNPGSSRVGAIVVMAIWNISGAYPGDVAEILIYNTALATTDRQNVENYLKAKYGL